MAARRKKKSTYRPRPADVTTDDPLEGLTLRLDQVAVPKELAGAWKKLLASGTKRTAIRVLYRVVVLGMSWQAGRDIEEEEQKAAHEAGGPPPDVATWQSYYRVARSFDLYRPKAGPITEGFGRLVELSQQELEGRLVAKPEEMETKDLTQTLRVAGESWSAAQAQREGSRAYVSLLDRLARQLGEGGGGAVTLELRVEPAPAEARPTPPEIDVTPES